MNASMTLTGNTYLNPGLNWAQMLNGRYLFVQQMHVGKVRVMPLGGLQARHVHSTAAGSPQEDI